MKVKIHSVIIIVSSSALALAFYKAFAEDFVIYRIEVGFICSCVVLS